VWSDIREVSGIKITGYPTDGKIRHPTRSLKPHHRGPSKTDLPKTLIACQPLVARTTNSIPPEPCGKVSGEMGASGGIFLPRPSPHDVIKAPDPLGILPSRPRDTWNLLARREATGAPSAAPAPADGTDVTARSQQQHRNHTLTQHDLVIPQPRHPYLYSNGGNDHYTT
jgi:hypothetical protein